MNYEFEGNINFSEELNKMICEETTFDNNSCLITGEKLIDKYIELTCGHKFNYNSIFNELRNQRKNNNLETQELKKNQVKCPYCRSINNGILPYYEGYKKLKNINWSSTNKKIHKQCIAQLKTGKRKGKVCMCRAKFGDFCGRHKN